MSAELSFEPEDDLMDSLQRDRDAISKRMDALEGELGEMQRLTARLARLRMRIDHEHRRLGDLLGQLDTWLELQTPIEPSATDEPEDPWGIADSEEVVPLWVRPVQTQPIQFSKAAGAPKARILVSKSSNDEAICDETIPIQLKPFDLPGRSPTFSRKPRCSPESE